MRIWLGEHPADSATLPWHPQRWSAWPPCSCRADKCSPNRIGFQYQSYRGTWSHIPQFDWQFFGKLV